MLHRDGVERVGDERGDVEERDATQRDCVAERERDIAHRHQAKQGTHRRAQSNPRAHQTDAEQGGDARIKLAGGDPLTSGKDGVYQLQAEQVLDFDPEVILLGDAAYGVTPDQVAARPGWGKLAAVKHGDVRPIDDVIVTRPGPRLDDGIRALALAIHPDLVLPSPAP